MAHTLVDALVALKPKAQWVLNTQPGDTDFLYSRLTWLDQIQTKPTEDEINTWLANNP